MRSCVKDLRALVDGIDLRRGVFRAAASDEELRRVIAGGSGAKTGLGGYEVLRVPSKPPVDERERNRRLGDLPVDLAGRLTKSPPTRSFSP